MARKQRIPLETLFVHGRLSGEGDVFELTPFECSFADRVLAADGETAGAVDSVLESASGKFGLCRVYRKAGDGAALECRGADGGHRCGDDQRSALHGALERARADRFHAAAQRQGGDFGIGECGVADRADLVGNDEVPRERRAAVKRLNANLGEVFAQRYAGHLRIALETALIQETHRGGKSHRSVERRVSGESLVADHFDGIPQNDLCELGLIKGSVDDVFERRWQCQRPCHRRAAVEAGVLDGGNLIREDFQSGEARAA